MARKIQKNNSDTQAYNKAVTSVYEDVISTNTDEDILKIIEQAKKMIEDLNKGKKVDINVYTELNGLVEKLNKQIKDETGKDGKFGANVGKLQHIVNSLSGRISSASSRGGAIVSAIGSQPNSALTPKIVKKYRVFTATILNKLQNGVKSYNDAISEASKEINTLDEETKKIYKKMAKARVKPDELEEYINVRKSDTRSKTANKFKDMDVVEVPNYVNDSRTQEQSKPNYESERRKKYFSRNKNAKTWVDSAKNQYQSTSHNSLNMLNKIIEVNKRQGRDQFVVRNPQTGEAYLLFGNPDEVKSAKSIGDYSKLASLPIGTDKNGNLIKNGKVQSDVTNAVVDNGQTFFLNSAQSVLHYAFKSLTDTSRGRLDGKDLQIAMRGATSMATRNSMHTHEVGKDAAEDFNMDGHTLNINSVIDSVFASQGGYNKKTYNSKQARDKARSDVAKNIVELVKTLSRAKSDAEGKKILENAVESGIIKSGDVAKLKPFIGVPIDSISGSQNEYESGILTFMPGNGETSPRGKQGSRHNRQGGNTQAKTISLDDGKHGSTYAPYIFDRGSVRPGFVARASTNEELNDKWEKWLETKNGKKWLKQNPGRANELFGTLTGGGAVVASDLPEKFETISPVKKQINEIDFEIMYSNAINNLKKQGKDIKDESNIYKQIAIDEGWSKAEDIVGNIDAYFDDIAGEYVINFEKKFERSGIPKIIDNLLGIRAQTTLSLPRDFFNDAYGGADFLFGEADIKQQDATGFMLSSASNLLRRAADESKRILTKKNAELKKVGNGKKKDKERRASEMEKARSEEKQKMKSLFNLLFEGTGLEGIFEVDENGRITIKDDEKYQELINGGGADGAALLTKLRENIDGIKNNEEALKTIGISRDEFDSIVGHEFVSQAVPFKDYPTEKGVLLGELQKKSELSVLNRQREFAKKEAKNAGKEIDENLEKAFEEEKKDIEDRYRTPEEDRKNLEMVRKAFDAQVMSGSELIRKKAGNAESVEGTTGMYDITIGYGDQYAINLADQNVVEKLNAKVDRNFSDNSVNISDIGDIFYGLIDEKIADILKKKEEEIRKSNPNISQKEIDKQLEETRRNITVALFSGVNRDVSYTFDGNKKHSEAVSILSLYGSGNVKDMAGNVAAVKLPAIYDSFVKAARAVIEYNENKAGDGSDSRVALDYALNTYGNDLNKQANDAHSAAVESANKKRLSNKESSLSIAQGISQEAIDKIAESDQTRADILQYSEFVSKNTLEKRFGALSKESLKNYYETFVGGKSTKRKDMIAELTKVFTYGTKEFEDALTRGLFDDMAGFSNRAHRTPALNDSSVAALNMFAMSDITDDAVKMSDALLAMFRGDNDRDHIASWVAENKNKDHAEVNKMLANVTKARVDLFKDMMKGSDKKDDALSAENLKLIDSLSVDELQEINDIAKKNRALTGRFHASNSQYRNSMADKYMADGGVNEAYMILGGSLFEALEQDAISAKHTIEQLKGVTDPKKRREIIDTYKTNVAAMAEKISSYDSGYTMDLLFSDMEKNGMFDSNGLMTGKYINDAIANVLKLNGGEEILTRLGINYKDFKNGKGTISKDQFRAIFEYIKDTTGVEGILTSEGGFGNTLLGSKFNEENGKRSQTEHSVMQRIAEQYGKAATEVGKYITETQSLSISTSNLNQLIQVICSLLDGKIVPGINSLSEQMDQEQFFLHLAEQNSEYSGSKEYRRISSTGERQFGKHYNDNFGFADAVNRYKTSRIVYMRDPNNPLVVKGYKQTNDNPSDLSDRRWFAIDESGKAVGDEIKDQSVIDSLNRLGYSEKDFAYHSKFFGATDKGDLYHAYAEAMANTGAKTVDEAIKKLASDPSNSEYSSLLEKIRDHEELRKKQLRALGNSEENVDKAITAARYAVDNKMLSIRGVDDDESVYSTEGKTGVTTGDAKWGGSYDLLRVDKSGAVKVVDFKTQSGAAKPEQFMQLMKYIYSLQNVQQIMAGLFDFKNGSAKNMSFEEVNGILSSKGIQKIDEKTYNALLKSIERTYKSSVENKKPFKNIDEFKDALYDQWSGMISAGDESGGQNFYLSSWALKKNIADTNARKIIHKALSGEVLSEDEQKFLYSMSERGTSVFDSYVAAPGYQNDQTKSDQEQANLKKEYIELLKEQYELEKKIADLKASGMHKNELDVLKEREKEIKDALGDDKFASIINEDDVTAAKSEINSARSYDNAKRKDKETLKNSKELNSLYAQRLKYETDIEKLRAKENLAITDRERNAYLTQEYDTTEKLAQVKKSILEYQKAGVDLTEREAKFSRDLEFNRHKISADMKGQQTFWDVLARDITRSTYALNNFNIAHKVVQKIPQDIRKVINITKQLDQVLTNVSIVTGESREGAEKYLNTYIDLANQLGVTTQQVASASVEWLRQGYSVQESQKLVTASMHLSKLGLMDASAATSSLT